MLVKCNLNILFQITVKLNAISSSDGGIPCVLGIYYVITLHFKLLCREMKTEKERNPPNKSPSK